MAQGRRAALAQAAVEKGSHAGLILDRYLLDERDDSRTALLGQAESAPRQAADIYRVAFVRRAELLQGLPGAVLRTFQTDNSFLAVGLGNRTPLEIGLTLNHTFGVPIVPGSALKGLAARYCRTVWGKADPGFESAHHDVIFGTSEESGSVVFHDAWVDPGGLAHCLTRDVITTHHRDYYTEAAAQRHAPTDFDNPEPHQFLSARGDYLVALSASTTAAGAGEWVALALQLLTEALASRGIGGKTNAGYGRMRPLPTEANR
jgi:CRISPR-associated protein Cmr6